MQYPNAYNFEAVAAGQTDQALGATGKQRQGDYLLRLICTPLTVAPGIVAIQDGAGVAAVNVYAGSAAYDGGLAPFTIELGLKSKVGGWFITTGANIQVIAVGAWRG